VGYRYIVINISTKECDFEIANLFLKKKYVETTQHLHSVISCVRLIIKYSCEQKMYVLLQNSSFVIVLVINN